MNEQQVRAIFTLARLDVLRIWKLPNGYLGEQEPLTDDQIERDAPGSSGYRMVTDTGPTEGVVRAWMADYRWRYDRPAWLVQTSLGLIQVTERKRVIDLEWSDTPIRAIVTSDDTTKDTTRVHAWTEEKLIEYLREWVRVSKEA